ncbi:MAG: biotin--[acetyl-CoA-carboxylase] ligase [Opitutales bacterium]
MTTSEYRELSCSEDEFTLVKLLLDAKDGYVSGTRFAELLGISRPAVWAKLEKLREKGFAFEGVRNRGYRLTALPETLHPALALYYLGEIPDGFELLYFPVIDSTNSEADRQLAYGRRAPFAIASSCQTRGRGRLGRSWYSASAENLYLSVLFKPNIPPKQLQHFTLWAGIHICRALQKHISKAKLRIKWPNDLQCSGRKFAGMLTEAKLDADTLHSIIFGIGINVNSNPTNYPSEIRSTATSLYAVEGEPMPLNRLAADVLRAILNAFEACTGAPPSESLPDAWAELSALRGRNVTAIQGGNEVSGAVTGIDPTGALILQHANGSRTTIRAGDVTLKQ